MSRKRKAKRLTRVNQIEVEDSLPVSHEVSGQSKPFSGTIEFNKPSIIEDHLVLREIRTGMDFANDPKDPELDRAIEQACDQSLSTEAIFQAMAEGLHQWRERWERSFGERDG